MTVQLRPHHLLCLLTYVGRGYDPAFTANFDAIARRIVSGDTVLVVDGPDDVCAPLLGREHAHCSRASVRARDALAADEIGRLIGRPVSSGARIDLTADFLRRLRQAFASGRVRTACAGCEWSELCSAVAGTGFDGTRVHPRPAPRA